MKEWYYKNLGLVPNEYGSLFAYLSVGEPGKKCYWQWSPFEKSTTYFDPSEKPFMINFRVENLKTLVEELREAGVTILDDIEQYPYGKFIHVMDPEGNKIELWEPVDEEFTKLYEGKTTI